MHMSNVRRFCIKPKTKRGSRKIHEHFEKSGQITNLNLFPADSKRVTRKKNQQIHVANEQAAQQIASLISRFHKKDVPFVELSPGPCILSKALLNQLDMETLVLIQMDNEFAPIQQVCQSSTWTIHWNFKHFLIYLIHLQQLLEEHPSKVRLNSVKAKWSFHSSIRESIFQLCKQREWCDDVVCQLFFYSKLEDIHRLNAEVTQQSGFFANGRIEIFAIMTPLDFMVKPKNACKMNLLI